MKEWLLKEEKNKVGRPRLADEKVLKKAKLLLAFSVLFTFFLCFSFFSVLNGSTPSEYAKELLSAKLQGVIEKKDAFLVNEYYNDNHNYVINFKITDVIYAYSGSYVITIYELENNDWKESQTKEFDAEERDFKVVVKSLKNENKTYKIKFQIKNASSITRSYAPYGWSFVNGDTNEDKYAYKTFTVKGYYSPVSLDEINEAKESNNKITVTTTKKEPRCFIVSLPSGEFKINVKYTDDSDKKILLESDSSLTGEKTYCVPNQNKSSNVTFKIYADNVKKLKLSNWQDGDGYITNTYLLKPQAAYEN